MTYTEINLWFITIHWWPHVPAIPQAVSLAIQYCGGTQAESQLAYVWWDALQVVNVYAGAFLLAGLLAWLVVIAVRLLRG